MRASLRLLRASAFTLVELLIVLVLLGMLSTSAVVAFQGRDRPYALRVSGEDLGAAFRSAGNASRAGGKPHRVVLDIAGRLFWVETYAPAADGGFAQVSGLAGRLHAFADGVTVISTGELQPDPDGRVVFPFGPGAFPAMACGLATVDGDRLWVRVAAGTGQVVLDDAPQAEGPL